LSSHETYIVLWRKTVANRDQFEIKKGMHQLERIKEVFEQVQQGDLKTDRFFADTAKHLVPHLVARR